nr:anti-sigma factor [Bacteroidota bacterium]
MKRIALISLVALVMAGACKKKDDENPQPDPMTKNLTLDISGLENLGSHYAYEGWIIVDGAPVSTGVFMVDDNGKMSKSTFSISETVLDNASTFVLTIEPSPDSDPSPSSVHILAGDFSGSGASLMVDHGAALGNDFVSVAGTFILATPTTSTMDDELSGVWFLDLSSGSPAVGLMNLPALPDGWVYEGWAVTNGVPVTSGRFSVADMADYSAPYSGTDAAGPPFPGEDFVSNAPMGVNFPTNLSGGKAVISIEPEPDNSPNPFLLKPLVGDVPANAMDHKTYMMNNNAAGFPTGTASR